MSAHSLQLEPPLEVETEHGEGWALVLTDYGPGINAIWTVATKADGKIRHYETNQVRLSRNFTFRINLPKAAEKRK